MNTAASKALKNGHLLDNAKAAFLAARAKGILEKPRTVTATTSPAAPPIAPVIAAAPAKLAIAVETITPVMAQEWLDKFNRSNRKLKGETVLAYARDMQAGKWLITHQGIAFANDGTLIDGQHRLAAIVRANVNVAMLVIRGVPTEQSAAKTMDAVDRGVTRTIADQLGLRGYSDPNLVAGAVAIIAKLCCGDKARVRKLTTHQTLTIIENYKESIRFVIENRSRAYGIRSATFLGAVAFAHAGDPVPVEQFYRSAVTGENLTAQNPALVLRTHLMDKGCKTGALERRQQAETILYAIHQFKEGKAMAKVTWSRAGLDYFRSKQLEKITQVTRLFISIQ